MSTTAATSGFTDTVPYTYTGFHAYFAVRVHLDAFVVHNGITTTNLVTGGPVNCCTPPSGGFTYSGNHSFVVADGDTYGFTLGGVNYDSNTSFYGTLTLAPPPTPPFTDPAAVAANTSWTTAAPLTGAGVDGMLTQAGEVRWYKFPIQPDSQVQVDLSNLDQNFDLTMFRDIGQTFTSLTTAQDLTKLSAQFAGDVFSPSVYSPSVYSPSVYSPSVYSPVGLLAIGLQPIRLQPVGLLTIRLQPVGLLTVGLLTVGLLTIGLQPIRLLAVCCLPGRRSPAPRPAASSASRPTRTPTPNPSAPRRGTTPAISTCEFRVATARSRRRRSTSD